MPAGHPFQGSQPAHLENQEIKIPRRPFLQRAAPKRNLLLLNKVESENYDTEKMMRYDDFTNEDVGNIIMDAEPLPNSKSDDTTTLKNLAKEANSYPGIEEFDENLKKMPYQTAGNRPIVRLGYRNRNFRHFGRQQGN